MSSEHTGKHRILSLAEAQAVLREIADEVTRLYSEASSTDTAWRKVYARRLLALEMGAQSLDIADLEERRNAARRELGSKGGPK